MNTQNIFTIHLQESQEDISTGTLSSNEWQHLKENSFSALAELKKMKLLMYKEKLNLCNETSRIKDDVILALKTCLETYKHTNLHNSDLISFLKAKLAEKRANFLEISKSYQHQIAELETTIKRTNDQILTQDSIIKHKDNDIAALEEKLRKCEENLKEKTEACTEYKNQIITLQTTIDDNNMKMAEQESTIKNKDLEISVLEADIASNVENIRSTNDLVNNWKSHVLTPAVNSKDSQNAELRQSEESIKKQSEHLLQYTIKQLQDSLGGGDSSTKIKVVSLPRFGSFKVVCEKGTAGKDWIVIQRRTDSFVNFNQGWFCYVDGFGGLNGDFWIGLDKIYSMTKYQRHELYIHLVLPNNEIRYAHYDNFAIGGKMDDYKLKSIGNYYGNAGDGLRVHEHQVFKTVRYELKNTVEYNRWWHCDYPSCNLNGSFNQKNQYGVWWCTQNGAYKFVESVQMLLRPKQK